MKFIDEFDIELVNQHLSFDTADSHVEGTIDLFKTKPIGTDKKLYKTITKNWDQYLQEHAHHQLQAAARDDDNDIDEDDDAIMSSPITSRLDVGIKKQRSFSTSNIKNKPVAINGANMKNNSPINAKPISKSLHSHHSDPYISPSSLTDTESCVFGPFNEAQSRRSFAYLIGILNTCYPDHDFSSLNPDFFTLIPSWTTLVNNVNNLLISLGKSEQDLNWIWDIINGHMDLADCVCFEFDNDFAREEILNNASVLWCNFYFLYNKKKKRVAFLQLKSTFTQARRGSLLNNNYSRDALDTNDNEYDLSNDVDEDAMMDEDDEDDVIEDEVVGGLEF